MKSETYFIWSRSGNKCLGFHYLDDTWVGECLVQDVQLAAELQGVDDEVLLSGGDLHQRRDAQETPVGMVLPKRETECRQTSPTGSRVEHRTEQTLPSTRFRVDRANDQAVTSCQTTGT